MEDKYLQQDTSFDNTFGKLINKYIPQIEQVKIQSKPNVQQKYQYQELCKKLYPIYGKRIYTLAYEKWYTDYKLETAHKMCQKYNKEGNINYLIKVMRNMKTL